MLKLLLQTDWQADNMTAPVKQAIKELAWKGEEVWKKEVYLSNMVNLNGNDVCPPDYIPIGTVEFIQAYAKKHNIKLPQPIHATELLDLEGRWWLKNTPKYRILNFPVLVKPLTEHKKFTGFVAKSDKDFDLYPDVDWDTTKLFCTQVIDNIVSEWRCYVLKGEVFACVNYAGDPLKFPNRAAIANCIDNFKSAPIAYSLDMAVTDHTQFIEINDAYALGYYGGDVVNYTKMLDLRWKEIIQNQ